jgi:hypothetical protein
LSGQEAKRRVGDARPVARACLQRLMQADSVPQGRPAIISDWQFPA